MIKYQKCYPKVTARNFNNSNESLDEILEEIFSKI